MATKASIKERAARRLTLVGRGQAFRAEEVAEFESAYSEVHTQLSILGIATWDFDEPIPDEYATHVVALVAFNKLPDYPVDPKRASLIIAQANAAIPAIRELQASDVYTTAADFY